MLPKTREDHVEEQQHKCIVCAEELCDDAAFRKHLKSHNEVFGEEQFELLANILPNGRLECLICGVTLACKRNFQVHYQGYHSTKRPFECPVCHKRFKISMDYILHREIHYPNRTRYKCKKCGKTFVHKPHFASHVKAHSAKKERCEVCFKYFPANLLRGHYYIHTREFRVPCSICGKDVRESHMKGHIKAVHETQGEDICVVCGARYKTTRSLVVHVRKHTDEPVEVCSICSRPFYEKYLYVKHMERSHGCGTKEWQCSVCPKAFHTKAQLEVHMVVHTEEKPYKCRVCGKGFAWKHKIKDHMKTHSEERPFQCTLCGEAFKWKHNLANHHRARHVSH